MQFGVDVIRSSFTAKGNEQRSIRFPKWLCD